MRRFQVHFSSMDTMMMMDGIVRVVKKAGVHTCGCNMEKARAQLLKKIPKKTVPPIDSGTAHGSSSPVYALESTLPNSCCYCRVGDAGGTSLVWLLAIPSLVGRQQGRQKGGSAEITFWAAYICAVPLFLKMMNKMPCVGRIHVRSTIVHSRMALASSRT